jgi:hypothetical protein
VRARRPPAPVVEVWIDTLVVDASWPRRSRDQLEAALRAGLAEELLGLAAPGAASPARDVERPDRPRLADDVTLSCPTLRRSDRDGPEAVGIAAGRAIGSDLGERVWPAGRPGGNAGSTARGARSRS